MKTFLIILLVVLVIFMLVSCVGHKQNKGEHTEGTTDIIEKNEETLDEVDKKSPIVPINVDDYYKAVLFKLPDEPFRDAIVNYMRKQASLEWICSENFGVSEKWANWGIDLTFVKGQKYTGIPYADTKVSYIQFEEALVNGTYTCESMAWKDVFGVQCVSSIMNSIQQFDPSVYGLSDNLTPGVKNFRGKICGDYNVPENVRKSNQIITANTPEDMYKAYTQLKKGDIVITKDFDKGTSHLRVVVEEPNVVKTGAGKINPYKSSIKCIEQTNCFDKTRTDGVKTTWYVDHIYTFDKLYSTDYVPVTLEIYDKDITECELPYILLDNEITEEQIQCGVLSSTVKSNFPIRYVYLDVYNKSGELVKRSMAYDMASKFTVNFRNYSMPIIENLENGEYTFVATAGIAIDSAELARVDFTYKK